MLQTILKNFTFKKSSLITLLSIQCRNASGIKTNPYYLLEKPLGENREKLADNIKFDLYQYSYCPFCFKVRSYLRMNRIPFNTIDVDRATKKEIEFTPYRMVPIAIIDKNEVVDSRLILSVLESHLITGKSIESLIKKYDILQIDGGKKVQIENPYQIFDSNANNDLVEYRKREASWRRIINDKYYKLLAINTFYSLQESIIANYHISKSLKGSIFHRCIYNLLGGPGMFLYQYFKHFNDPTDARRALYEACNEWVEEVDSKKFHGGNFPNLADIEMYGALKSLEKYPVFKLLFKDVPSIQRWYDDVNKIYIH